MNGVSFEQLAMPAWWAAFAVALLGAAAWQRRAGLVAGAIAIVAVVTVLGAMIWALGQIGDGDQFDAPRERVAITNATDDVLYLIGATERAGFDAALTEQTLQFARRTTGDQRTLEVILYEGTWHDLGEACYPEERLPTWLARSRSGEARYGLGVVELDPVDLEELALFPTGCWSKRDARMTWNGTALAQNRGPYEIPIRYGWATALSLAVVVPIGAWIVSRRRELDDAPDEPWPAPDREGAVT